MTSSRLTVCASPDQYLFFDDIHPTAATQRYTGDALYNAAVPEPATVLLIGSALVLIGMRRRMPR